MPEIQKNIPESCLHFQKFVWLNFMCTYVSPILSCWLNFIIQLASVISCLVDMGVFCGLVSRNHGSWTFRKQHANSRGHS